MNFKEKRWRRGCRLVGEERSRRRIKAEGNDRTSERASTSELSCLFCGAEFVPGLSHVSSGC